MTSAPPDFTTDPATAVATVVRLRIFPLKSAQGLDVDEAPLSSSGLDADRSFAVVDDEGAPLRVKDFPQLRQIVTQIVPDAGAPLHALELRLPGHTNFLPADEAGEALSDLLGRRARVAGGEGENFAKTAPIHLVSTLAPDTRANITVQFPLAVVGAARTEPRWKLGSQGRVNSGGIIELDSLPKHCSGVYAVVRAEGLVRVGDQIFMRPRG